MIRTAAPHLAAQGNVELVVNLDPHLARWQEGTFDLVFSYICLQHMPWPIAAQYLTEFSRVCSRDGWVAFQLPTRVLQVDWGARIRRALVDHAPFGIGAAYRRWRHGTAVAFQMHFTPAAVVEAACARAGLRPVHREPNLAAGKNTEGYFYICRKSPAA
jgi:hypothetical protein